MPRRTRTLGSVVLGVLALGAVASPLSAQQAPAPVPPRAPLDSARAPLAFVPRGSDCPMPVVAPGDGVDSMPTAHPGAGSPMPTMPPTCTNSLATGVGAGRATPRWPGLRTAPVWPKR